VTSSEAGRQDQNVQPVSLSVELDDPIDTSHSGFAAPRSAQAWPVPASSSSRADATSVAPQLGPALDAAPLQSAATLQGPGFGGGGTTTETGTGIAFDDEFSELALEADTESSGGFAGKSFAFWAMIGGLVLLLGCALLKRPADSRDSFH
jgi:hypothetical protein